MNPAVRPGPPLAPPETPALRPRAGTPGVPLRPAFAPNGVPSPRLARFTARMAFVDVKRDFLDAVATLDGADWLRRQLRAAEQPSDLWLLRGAVCDALVAAGRRAETPPLRLKLAALLPQGLPGVRL